MILWSLQSVNSDWSSDLSIGITYPYPSCFPHLLIEEGRRGLQHSRERRRCMRCVVAAPRLSRGDALSRGRNKGVKGACLTSGLKLSKGAPSSRYVPFPFSFFLFFFLFSFFVFSFFLPASGMQEQGFLFSVTHYQNDLVGFFNLFLI